MKTNMKKSYLRVVDHRFVHAAFFKFGPQSERKTPFVKKSLTPFNSTCEKWEQK